MTLPPDAHEGRAPPRWMACYVLLGLVQAGMIPVMLPLAARPGPTAGLTYSAFAAAGIAAPFIGAWSDRRQIHRLTLAGGLAVAGIALFLHTLPGGIAQHMASAAVLGLGVSSATTVATMFIVEVEPPSRWDRQIGALQACSAGGQLAGLLLAGVLGLRHVGDAFLLGGVLLLLAVPLALAFAPAPIVKVERPSLAPRPVKGEVAPMGTQRTLQRPTLQSLRALGHSPLAWFLAAWLVSYTASNGMSVMFAVAMVRDYHASAALPTTAYAIGVGCSLLLYRVVGGWDNRFGPSRVLSVGLAVRASCLAGMVALTASHAGGTLLPILVCFGVTQLVWPLLSVASTTLAVTLSPARRAESVGLLNAATALGATVGGALGGILLRSGFAWLCAATLAALLAALLLAWHPRVRLDPVAPSDA